MNFLDAYFLCVTFTEQSYISRSCGMKCRFSGTFLYINLLVIAPQEGRRRSAWPVIMKLVSLAGKKCMRTIHVVQMQYL